MKIFNHNKISTYDIISVIVYLLLTILVANITSFFKSIETQRTIVLIYSFSTSFLLYVFNYKSLRNIKIFIVWLIFGLYHLFLYRILSVNTDLIFPNGHAAHGLQFTCFFLVLFELFRIIHLKFFGYELVSLSRSTTDLWDNREIRLPDIVFFFLYFFLWMLVMFFIQ